MPAAALVIIGLQIFCGVHAVRNGHSLYWLLIIALLPLLGCTVYFLAIILPEMRNSPSAHRAARDMVKIVDPDRDYRARLRDAEMVGSADSKKRLAEECLARGNPGEAIALYESAATGPHAGDPALLFGLARARFAAGDAQGAQRALDDLRDANPDWQSAEGHMIYARALEAQDKLDEALIEYEALVRYYAGEEARCRLGLLYQKLGRTEDARGLFTTIVQNINRGTNFYKRQQREWLRVAQSNL